MMNLCKHFELKHGAPIYELEAEIRLIKRTNSNPKGK